MSTVQLTIISYETGSVVRWYAAARQIVDIPRAEVLRKREYRHAWTHPYVGW
jgi:hypothetical protein